MWCEFHVRKYNKTSQAVLSLSVYWFKWKSQIDLKLPEDSYMVPKRLLEPKLKNWEETKYNGGVGET